MSAHRLLLSAALLAICFSASVKLVQAQRGAPGGTAPATAARPSAVHARPMPVRVGTSARPVAKSSAGLAHNPSRLSPDGFFGVGGSGAFGGLTPGLGFESFGNFSAANQDLWLKAAIDPATEWRLFEKRRFLGNGGFGAGFYLLDGGYYQPYEPSAEPADAGGQASAEEQQGGPSGAESAEAAPAEQQPAYESSAPVEDVGQFVLVLRNGTQIQTIAFTRANDHIVYVTTDGFRRTLALADLDTGATIRVNEERGTPLQIPL